MEYIKTRSYNRDQETRRVPAERLELANDVMGESRRPSQGDVGLTSASLEGPEGVELDRSKIVGLNVYSQLKIVFRDSTHLGVGRVKQLAHEIDQMIRNRNTPWVSLTRIKNRYLVVESASPDTFINQAFLKLDYEMKMCTSGASLMLPYDLITEEKVQAQCDILDAVEAKKMSISDAYKRLEAIGFLKLELNDAYSQVWSDKGHYQHHDYLKLVHERGLKNMTFSRLCIKGRLMKLKQQNQDRTTYLFPKGAIYIEQEDIFSNGKLYQTSDDTKHLDSLLSYLKSLEHLKEAFAVVEWVTVLFPLIEQLIREGKKIPFSPARLEILPRYSPPKTPRRVPPAIMDDYEKKGLPIFGGCSLSAQTLFVEPILRTSQHSFEWYLTDLNKQNWIINSNKRTPTFRVQDQDQDEKEMYASAISHLNESKSDLKSVVDPAFFQDVVREMSRQLCSDDFTREYLGLKSTPYETRFHDLFSVDLNTTMKTHHHRKGWEIFGGLEGKTFTLAEPIGRLTDGLSFESSVRQVAKAMNIIFGEGGRKTCLNDCGFKGFRKTVSYRRPARHEDVNLRLFFPKSSISLRREFSTQFRWMTEMLFQLIPYESDNMPRKKADAILTRWEYLCEMGSRQGYERLFEDTIGEIAQKLLFVLSEEK